MYLSPGSWANRAHWRTRARLQSFQSDEKGTTAIEFAMVATPFFFLLFGIMSVGFYFFTVFTLENAVESAARMIRTGQAQQQQPTPMTVEQFKTLVCNKLPGYMNCNGTGNKIRVNVQNFTGFNTVTVPSCTDGSGNLITSANQTYSPGGASTVVLVSVCYEWELTQAFVNNPFWIKPNGGNYSGSQMSNGSTLVQASTVFTVEPYQ